MTHQTEVPCPDLNCQDGFIVVHNAYSADPLKGERQLCDTCLGRGFIVVSGLDTPVAS